MKISLNEFSLAWKDKKYVLAVVQGSSLLLVSFIVNYYAVRYATINAGPSIPDTLFNLLPNVGLRFLDEHGAFYLQGILILFVFAEVKRTPFFLNTLAVLIIVRAFFINLTMLGIPENVVQTKSFFTQGGDLFFSGHVAIPFLAFLVYFYKPHLKILFLFVTILMGAEVLLGHYHYSIDVFAAPFISYGVFVFCKKYLFTKWYTD